MGIGPHAEVPVRRFALVVGANDGGPDRVALRYARTDATRFAEVLHELGGVDPNDAVFLDEPDVDALRGGFDELAARLASATGPGRREVVVYYSGHSDEQGLLLSGQRLSYKALRAAVDALPADVRVIVLDSCAAGALARAKGGVRRPPFLVDASSDVSGHAFLTSSSADEVAQESDLIGGSFFTHYLVTGLRGAADVSEDGRVTLNEAYQFAFNETLARTESTAGGAQHAVYEIQLTGTGDLVLTDLRATSARLVLQPELEGRVFVRDEGGRLVAEMAKPAARAIELNLPAGTYSLRLARGNGTVADGKVVVTAGEAAVVGESMLAAAAVETAMARGPIILDSGAPEPVAPREEPADGGRTYVPVHVDVLPGVGVNSALADGPVRNNLAIHLLYGGTDAVTGVSAATLVGWVDDELVGAQIAGLGAWANGPVVGFQGGFGFAWAPEVRGLQATGVASVAERVEGVQFAGCANIADAVDGGQLTVVNVAGHVRGAQLGLINVADQVDGVQLGLLNVARASDVSFGLLSFVDEGIIDPGVWFSETSYLNAGIRLGGRYLYTMFFLGTQTFANDQANWIMEAGLGLGGRIYVNDWAHVDLDAQVSQFFTETGWHEETVVSRLRLGVGFSVTSWLTVFGGGSVNVLSELLRDALTIESGPFDVYVVHPRTPTDDVRIALFPGFFAGVEF